MISKNSHIKHELSFGSSQSQDSKTILINVAQQQQLNNDADEINSDNQLNRSKHMIQNMEHSPQNDDHQSNQSKSCSSVNLPMMIQLLKQYGMTEQAYW